MSTSARFGPICEALVRDGYSVSEGFVSPDLVAALARRARSHELDGNLVRGTTGKVAHDDTSVRGDSILWLESDGRDDSVAQCLATYEQLRMAVNEQLFLNVHDLECHFAVYPPGAGYQRHLDQFAGGDQRRQLSMVLYLNPDWHAEHGGALRLNLDGDASGEYLDIFPAAGRLVLFESSRFWHQVLPATRQRLSITGWFRTRS